MSNTSPRVLHIVENMERGAVENWLLRMFKYGREKGLDLDWTFYCALGREGKLDEEVRSLGGRIIYSPVATGSKRKFVKALRSELRRGRYEVLHCHHDLISGVYLAAAARLPIRLRIAHVHNADENVLTPNKWKQMVWRPLLRAICLAQGDKVVGISRHTLTTFLNGRPRRDGRDLVVYYGVDPSPFYKMSYDRREFRRSLGLNQDAPLLLFAGRIVPEKNPLFVIDVLSEIKKSQPHAAAIFVGSGGLRDQVANHAQELGLGDNVRFLGWRDDIAQIMMCCDWFILPRPEYPQEGFGLAVVEAQLASLRLLLSKGIPDDPLLASACTLRLYLKDGPKKWAHAAIVLCRQKLDRERIFADFAKSPFALDFALRRLLELYA